jgi:hypothetical protein
MGEERIDHNTENATTSVDGVVQIPKEERQSLEIEKLRREVNKLGLEARLLSRNARTQILTMVIPAVTTLVAVGGLLLSLYSQNTQNKRTAEYRRADDFAALIRQFGDGKPLASLGAIASLRSYAADPAYRGRVLDHAISLIGVERNEVVRETIRSFLLADPDLLTLQALAKQNRFFSGHLAHLAKADDEPFPQFHTWATNPPEGSEELRRAFDDLGWNIETIVRVINQLKTIENVDLSGVALSRVVIGTSEKTFDEGFRRDRVRFENGIIFQNVNLEGANLAEVRFEGTTFRDVNFRDALLASADFSNCSFSGSTSLAGFRTELSALDPTSKIYKWLSPRYAANWYDCTIDVVAFFPVLNPEWENWQEEEQRYFNFFNCTWKVPSVTSPPTPPVKETTTRDPKSPQAGEPGPYPTKLILSSPGNKSHFDGKFSYPE